ncbi:MAG: oxygenase MpaB family protein, partial [Phenylobacterium sp.]|nr:oxygenase MpaB family protein [Phenylobacterium sp.]
MSALDEIAQVAWARLPASPLSGGKVDYRSPRGDVGFFGPGSMAWRVHANPIALAVGGVAAVILELAEPRVRTGVWEHSIFRTDPLARMQRTGEATLITTYGPTRAAEARIAMVTRMHERVFGTTPEGQAFTALDPELMTWVHLTAGWG